MSTQKAFDVSARVSTSALSASRLGSFVIKMDSKKTIDQIHRPIGGWPEHWLDNCHETEGRNDMSGVQPQQGQDVYEQEIMGLMIEEGQVSAWDGVTDNILDPRIIRQARMVELEYFRKLQAYTHVPRSHQRNAGGKIIGVR